MAVFLTQREIDREYPGLAEWRRDMELQEAALAHARVCFPRSLRRQRRYALRTLGWKRLMQPRTFAASHGKNNPFKNTRHQRVRVWK